MPLDCKRPPQFRFAQPDSLCQAPKLHVWRPAIVDYSDSHVTSIAGHPVGHGPAMPASGLKVVAAIDCALAIHHQGISDSRERFLGRGTYLVLGDSNHRKTPVPARARCPVNGDPGYALKGPLVVGPGPWTSGQLAPEVYYLRGD